jgi:hypothetical protein
MRTLIVVAAAVAVTMLAPTANAQSQMRDCMVAGAPVPIGFNGTGTIELSSGESCNLYLNTSGEIQSSAITQRPKNGSLKMVSAANVIYTPKPGYRGSDQFAVTLKGSTQRASGTSIVKITANVR